MFSELCFRAGGDSHQTWWRQTLGQAETVIKFGGGTRWVRRRQSSSLVETHVRSCGDRHQAWGRQTLGHAKANVKFGGGKR